MANAGRSVGREGILQRADEARLADPGLAGDDGQLSFAGLHSAPAFYQVRKFVVPTDHRRERLPLTGLEAGSR